jgi:hypothetical protein
VTPLIEYSSFLLDAYVQNQLELDVSQQTILDNLRTCNFNMKGDIVYKSSENLVTETGSNGKAEKSLPSRVRMLKFR